MIDEEKLIDELKQNGMIADNDYGNSMVDMIENQPKIGGWIPCSERLPEENKEVICCFKSGIVEALVFYNCKFHGKVYAYEKSDIIAWQPLPEPYHEP